MAVYHDVQHGHYVNEPVAEERQERQQEYHMNVLARVISLIGGTIMALLGLRFILALFGANPANAIANFIYDITRPFVEPFFGLFSYTPGMGKAHFELTTLFAIVVYGLLTMLLIKIATIGRHKDETY